MEELIKKLLVALEQSNSALGNNESIREKINEIVIRVAVIEEKTRNIESKIEKNEGNLEKSEGNWKWMVSAGISLVAVVIALFKATS